MSATLMALLQETVLKTLPHDQAEQKAVFMPPPGLAPPITSTPTALTCPVVAPSPEAAPSANMAGLLSELVKVVTEISRIDEMTQKVQSGAPTGAEALKWHEVSLRALSWSRDSLAQRQRALVEQMRDLATTPAPPQATQMIPESSTKAPQTVLAEPESAPTQNQVSELTLEPEREGAEYVGSLSNDLEKLRQNYEPEQCVLVRQIKQLGLKSPEKLREYFSQYGELADVLVAHSFEKPSAKRRLGRIRPAALGFVVFKSSLTAKVFLAGGEERVVGCGEDATAILVKPYEPADFHAEANN